MNIDIRKQEILTQLYRLKKECETLLERIPLVREDLLKVKTEEEAKMFDETHDLEEGLKIIKLF